MTEEEKQKELDKINNDFQKPMGRVNAVRKFGWGMIKLSGFLFLGVIIFVVFFSNTGDESNETYQQTQVRQETKPAVDLTSLNKFFDIVTKLYASPHEIIETTQLFEGYQIV